MSRRSQGNPFYVAELAGLLADPADGPAEASSGPDVLASPPAGVRDAVRARLARLTPRCREIVSAASVLGAEVDAACLAAVTGREVRDVLSALDEAAAAGIVTGAGRCRFAHDLVREAARLDVATVARLGLHERMAGYLLGRADAASRLPEVAFHCLEALPFGDPTRAVEWAERAAAQAMAQLAWEEAASLYRRAVAVADGTSSSPPIAAGSCWAWLGPRTSGRPARPSSRRPVSPEPPATSVRWRRRRWSWRGRATSRGHPPVGSCASRRWPPFPIRTAPCGPGCWLSGPSTP